MRLNFFDEVIRPVALGRVAVRYSGIQYSLKNAEIIGIMGYVTTLERTNPDRIETRLSQLSFPWPLPDILTAILITEICRPTTLKCILCVLCDSS